MTDHLSLAATHRPRSFDELIGQRHVAFVLRAAVSGSNVPQQLLFSGPSGVGKTTVARVLSAALFCTTALSERKNADPCTSCDACLDVLVSGRFHPDLVEFDAASNGGKDEIRDIAQRAQLGPLRARQKVFIIDEAHGLSGPGAQAALKLLEEPPSHVLFMLCTTDPQKMPKTIRGRCTEFELALPAFPELVGNLERVCRAERWQVPSEILEQIVRGTDPDLGVRGTLSNLSRLAPALAAGANVEDLYGVLGLPSQAKMKALFSAIVSGERAASHTTLDDLRASAPAAQIRASLLDWARRDYLAALGSDRADLALWRYRKIAEARSTQPDLDLLVAELVAPQLDPSPQLLQAELDALRAQLVEVSELRSKLEAAVTNAKEVGAALFEQLRRARQRNTLAESPATATPTGPDATTTPTKPVETKPADTTPGPRADAAKRTTPTPPALTVRPAAPPAPARKPVAAETSSSTRPATPSQRAADPGRASRQVHPPGHDGLSAAARALLAELPGPREDLVALLAAARVDLSDAVVVSFPRHLAAEFRPAEKDLRRAAGQLGLPLRLQPVGLEPDTDDNS